MGLGAAASVRVGNALGAGNAEQAITSGKISIICVCKKRVGLKQNIRVLKGHSTDIKHEDQLTRLENYY